MRIPETEALQLKIGVLAIAFSPLAIYSTSIGVSISFDRLLVICYFLLFPFRKNISRHLFYYIVLVLCFVSYILFSTMFSKYTSDPTALSYIMALLYFIIAIDIFSNAPEKQIAFIKRLFIVIIAGFAAWALYNQFVLLNIYYSPPFIDSYDDVAHKQKMMGNGRLFLPYASAPLLGFVSALLLLDKIVLKKREASKLEVFLSVVALVLILALTQSRSPLYALLVSLFVFTLLHRRFYDFQRPTTLLWSMIIALLAFFLTVYVDYDSLNNRVVPNISDLLNGRHFHLRFISIQLFENSSLWDKLFGMGLSAIHYEGQSPYSFTSYLTVLIEFGIVGLVLYLIISFSHVFVIFRSISSSKRLNAHFLGLLLLSIFIFLVHFLYEYKTFVPIWIFTGYIIGSYFKSLSPHNKDLKSV